jgi:hypothetical protein
MFGYFGGKHEGSIARVSRVDASGVLGLVLGLGWVNMVAVSKMAAVRNP